MFVTGVVHSVSSLTGIPDMDSGTIGASSFHDHKQAGSAISSGYDIAQEAVQRDQDGRQKGDTTSLAIGSIEKSHSHSSDDPALPKTPPRDAPKFSVSLTVRFFCDDRTPCECKHAQEHSARAPFAHDAQPLLSQMNLCPIPSRGPA
nr:hypothetical protein CFP56_31749 [Quercus suber]